MYMLKVIISLYVLMFSFNNQIFAIECNLSKFQKTLGELIASQYSDETKRKELARYSVCDDPIKNYYKKFKTLALLIVITMIIKIVQKNV